MNYNFSEQLDKLAGDDKRKYLVTAMKATLYQFQGLIKAGRFLKPNESDSKILDFFEGCIEQMLKLTDELYTK